MLKGVGKQMAPLTKCRHLSFCFPCSTFSRYFKYGGRIHNGGITWRRKIKSGRRATSCQDNTAAQGNSAQVSEQNLDVKWTNLLTGGATVAEGPEQQQAEGTFTWPTWYEKSIIYPGVCRKHVGLNELNCYSRMSLQPNGVKVVKFSHCCLAFLPV